MIGDNGDDGNHKNWKPDKKCIVWRIAECSFLLWAVNKALQKSRKGKKIYFLEWWGGDLNLGIPE